MGKLRSEDIVIFSGLTPEITDMSLFYYALEGFFKKHQSIDSRDRFNFILFQEETPEYLEEFTSDYELILSSFFDRDASLILIICKEKSCFPINCCYLLDFKKRLFAFHRYNS